MEPNVDLWRVATYDYQAVLWNWEKFTTPAARKRGKAFETKPLLRFVPLVAVPRPIEPGDPYPATYYSQIEVAAGYFLVGLRVGVNLGELADLLLGFAAIDIYGDDIHVNDGDDPEE